MNTIDSDKEIDWLQVEKDAWPPKNRIMVICKEETSYNPNLLQFEKNGIYEAFPISLTLGSTDAYIIWLCPLCRTIVTRLEFNNYFEKYEVL